MSKWLIERLGANAEAYHNDKITHEAFSATQDALWDEIRTSPAVVKYQVLEFLRNLPRPCSICRRDHGGEVVHASE